MKKIINSSLILFFLIGFYLPVYAEEPHFRIEVEVNMNNLDEKVKDVRVVCYIQDSPSFQGGIPTGGVNAFSLHGPAGGNPNIKIGVGLSQPISVSDSRSVNQTVTVEIMAATGKDPSDAKSYRCYNLLFPLPGAGETGWYHPTSAGGDHMKWRKIKPNSPNLPYVGGQISQ